MNKEPDLIYLLDKKNLTDKMKDKPDFKAEGGITYTIMPTITIDGKPIDFDVGKPLERKVGDKQKQEK